MKNKSILLIGIILLSIIIFASIIFSGNMLYGSSAQFSGKMQESDLPLCDYNVEYNSKDNCECEGIWSTYLDNPLFSTCADKNVSVCREIINQNKVSREVIVVFFENTTFEAAKGIIEKAGGIIREYDCKGAQFIPNRYTVVEVQEGQEDTFIQAIEQKSVVEQANQNRIGGTGYG
jgi:hypothetical protein|tara:strand:- start:1734 stop:2261 length:528 start_codon:yes stop_codon:yes gene_type:complete